MVTRTFLMPAVTVCTALGCLAQPQVFSRQATIVGGGQPDRGKCTIEVVVDGAAEVEIRGTNGVLRNLSGRPPQWRRFECTSPMPVNPGNFRFAGVDGRGRQDLIRDPRNGGVAVVRIEDPDNGAEGYTFDLFWEGGAYQGQGPGGGERGRYSDYPDDRYRPNYRDSDYYRRYGHGFAVDEAVRVCQDAIQQQAAARFRRAEFHFRGIRLDDGPGRQDSVTGSLDVHRYGREERFGFSCSVDFNTGRVRTAELDRLPMDGWRR